VPAGPSAGLPPAAELRVFLGQRLPEFMIPAVFTELAALPLIPSGKLDRAALPAPGATRPGSGYTAPATPTQELLAGIWAQVLGLDQIGIRDNFFDLGGHSLRAIQVVSRIRSMFEVEFPIAAFFDQPTIADLAVAINKSTIGTDRDGEEYQEFEF
jgi:acyl carrier protein